MRRVVVTGLGMVSPIGNTVEESWNNALAGKSGIGVITQFDASSFGSRIAGEVKNFEVEKYLPAKELLYRPLKPNFWRAPTDNDRYCCSCPGTG